MAITGIDTIDGKQIIAAGAVSAKSAEMAYNDENGNPITGYLTAVPTGTMNESAFGYDGSDNITAYNGSAIGGGSTPAYGYTDNGLISSIDTSGLYATSALEAKSANAVKDHGTLGYDLSSYLPQNTSYFYWMPANSPWTTADYATGIFSPLQYATGACLAMDNPATFKAYYKGNEWFVSNTVSNVGQMLRGEVHKTRGVHISGATTAGYGFNLGIGAVSGVNSTGTWKYGHAEDAALRAVSSCDMHESAFEYDASDNITGYNGSAFAGGSDVPEGVMVESGLEYNAVNEISAYNGSAIAQYGAEKQWLQHDGTLCHLSNSAQYALGVNLSAVAQLLGVDETVLYSGNATTTDFPLTLNEPMSSFDTIKFYWQTFNYDGKNWTVSEKVPVGNNNYYTLFDGIYNTATKAWYDVAFAFKEENYKLNYVSGAFKNWTANNLSDASGFLRMFKVVGIGRKQ